MKAVPKKTLIARITVTGLLFMWLVAAIVTGYAEKVEEAEQRDIVAAEEKAEAAALKNFKPTQRDLAYLAYTADTVRGIIGEDGSFLLMQYQKEIAEEPGALRNLNFRTMFEVESRRVQGVMDRPGPMMGSSSELDEVYLANQEVKLMGEAYLNHAANAFNGSEASLGNTTLYMNEWMDAIERLTKAIEKVPGGELE